LVADMLDVDLVGFFELVPDRAELLLCAGRGWPEGLVGKATVPAADGSPLGSALKTNEPVLVEDVAARGKGLLSEHGATSGVSVLVPAAADDGPPFGVFAAFSRRARHFAMDDVRFVHAVVN